MEIALIAKYGAAFALLASVYGLVLLGKVDPEKYVLLVTTALAALGVGAAIVN